MTWVHRLKPVAIAALILVPMIAVSQPPQSSEVLVQPKTAQKFDEFGDVAWSDLIARLDNFAVTLNEQPDTRGFIVVYRSRRDLPGLSHYLALMMQAYLVTTRGMPEGRVLTVDGGVAECLTRELWIVPPGSAPVPRSDARIGYFQFSDSAWKYLEYGFASDEENANLLRKDRTGAHLEAYVNEVRKRRSFVACIIAYAQYNARPGFTDAGNYDLQRETALDPPHTAPRQLAREKGLLMNVYGIPASKIRTINGGYRKRRAVELWIVPSGEPLPVPTPNSYPQRRKKVQQ